MKIRFLGAVRQVTGSRHYLEAGGLRILVDCGMFQEREFVGRNWEPSPVPADELDYLLLTHSHLDHCGLIPKLVQEGFHGTILATTATRELTEIILHDSAHIQKEDAAYKLKRHKRENRKSPHPVVALYSEEDVRATMPMFKKVRYGASKSLNDDVSVTFHDAGHILGSAILELTVRENGKTRTLVFTGDLGERNKPIIRDPVMLEHADYVVMESTYGGRNHPTSDSIEDQLCDIINQTVEKGGNIIIPTFAVERAQELMFHVGRLMSEDRIPPLLAFLDSPMAINVTEVFRRHRECMDEESLAIIESGEALMKFPGLSLSRKASQSKAINHIKGSCLIMAGSGMCTAGRIKHHLVQHIERPESTIVFVGYQARGTLGRIILEGNKRVRILGRQYNVKARIAQVHGMSAHADQDALMAWIGNFKAPRRVFIVHGEEESALELATLIRSKHGFETEVPSYQEEYELD